jgi:hypothetical protein
MQQTRTLSFAPNTLPFAIVPAAMTAAADVPKNCLRVKFMVRSPLFATCRIDPLIPHLVFPQTKRTTILSHTLPKSNP